MYPILFKLGDLIIPAWHFFYMLGAVSAFILLLNFRKRFVSHVPEYQISRLFIAVYLSSFLGARLLSIVIEQPEVTGFWETTKAMIKFGPMTFYGGAIGGLLGGLVFLWWTRTPLGEVFDIYLPAGLVALGFGRVGCFLNGDDYGLPVPLGEGGSVPWWATKIPVLEDGIPRYPVQLFEAIAAFLLAILLIVFFKRLRSVYPPGVIGICGSIGYAAIRFYLEFYRADFRGWVWGQVISTSQFISFLIMIVIVVILPFWIKRKPERVS